MAGVVSEYMCNELKRQAAEHGIVVWFDPQAEYAALVETMSIPDVAVERFAGSYLELRRRLETYVTPIATDGSWRERPDQVVVCVTASESDTNDALVDFTATGYVVAPGMSPWQRNTSLHVVARQALKGVLAPGEIDEIVSQIRDGELGLADVDQLADQRTISDFPKIALVFETTDPEHVALQILTDRDLDDEVSERKVLPELRILFERAFDFDAADGPDLNTLRQGLARNALLTEFVAGLGEFTPKSLQSLRVPVKSERSKALLSLTKTWRNRSDLAESYVAAAAEVEHELGADVVDGIDMDGLAKVETFEAADRALQTGIERSMREDSGDQAALISLAERRAEGFWSARDFPARDRWRMIVDAGRLLSLADRIQQNL